MKGIVTFMPFMVASGEEKKRLLTPAKGTQRKLLGGTVNVEPFDFTYLCCTQCRKKRDELQACGACLLTAYCDAVCQKAHWKAHKKVCLDKRRADEFREALKARREAEEW
jgi:alkyl hydroperoxide reductase subunit AhpC